MFCRGPVFLRHIEVIADLRQGVKGAEWTMEPYIYIPTMFSHFRKIQQTLYLLFPAEIFTQTQKDKQVSTRHRSATLDSHSGRLDWRQPS